MIKANVIIFIAVIAIVALSISHIVQANDGTNTSIPKNVELDRTNLETKHRPRDIIIKLRREFNHLLNNYFYQPIDNLIEDDKDFLPQMDFIEDRKAYHINLEIPGVDQKDVEISIQNQLEIKGEKKEEEDKDHFYSERSYGSFYRITSMPSDAAPDKTEAKFNNEILKITLPKSATKQKAIKKVEIKKE